MNQLLVKTPGSGITGLTAIVLCFAVGCGGSESSVSGTISIDGKPLVGSETIRATVMFYPESNGAPAAAKLDTNGTYSVSTGSQAGLPPGNYLVAISAREITGPTGAGPTSMRDLAALTYADPKISGLKAEVKPGRNTINFDLKSQP
jgi:hypothetical protein